MAPLHLNNREKTRLLQIARQTLLAYLSDNTLPPFTITEENLLCKVPVFITLWKKNGDLRGCVGRIEKLESLHRLVQICTISAATRDFRFPPVTQKELANLVIEISVLSPPEEITTPQEIEVGRHGLLIRQDTPSDVRVGLLLPKVASERNWGRQEFLEAVCRKAQLPEDAWQMAHLFTFETEVFAEGDL